MTCQFGKETYANITPVIRFLVICSRPITLQPTALYLQMQVIIDGQLCFVLCNFACRIRFYLPSSRAGHVEPEDMKNSDTANMGLPAQKKKKKKKTNRLVFHKGTWIRGALWEARLTLCLTSKTLSS